MQSLARLQLLNRFDYLSTVSGGGYIGSWLTAWIHRHPRGLDGVIEDLQATPNTNAEDRPHPVQWLRNYSNYLSPHLGFFSADSWTLLGIYLRNLHLNWMVLLPLLMLPLLLPRWVIALARLNTPDEPLHTAAVPALLLTGLGLAVMALIIYTSVVRRYAHTGSIRDGAASNYSNGFSLACLVPLVGGHAVPHHGLGLVSECRRIDGSVHFLQSVVGGTLIHTFSWLFATVALKRFKAITWWLV